jgi:hypothetical protein
MPPISGGIRSRQCLKKVVDSAWSLTLGIQENHMPLEMWDFKDTLQGLIVLLPMWWHYQYMRNK